jgi:hypothetical protein
MKNPECPKLARLFDLVGCWMIAIGILLFVIRCLEMLLLYS